MNGAEILEAARRAVAACPDSGARIDVLTVTVRALEPGDAVLDIYPDAVGPETLRVARTVAD